jgi:hypothetical protein
MVRGIHESTYLHMYMELTIQVLKYLLTFELRCQATVCLRMSHEASNLNHSTVFHHQTKTFQLPACKFLEACGLVSDLQLVLHNPVYSYVCKYACRLSRNSRAPTRSFWGPPSSVSEVAALTLGALKTLKQAIYYKVMSQVLVTSSAVMVFFDMA